MTELTAKRNKLIINLLIISAFVVILNETVMGVAIPHLMADLGITALAAQWLTTAFLLTMAVLMLHFARPSQARRQMEPGNLGTTIIGAPQWAHK